MKKIAYNRKISQQKSNNNYIFITKHEWEIYFLFWSLPKNNVTVQLQFIKEERGVGEVKEVIHD